MTGRDSIFGSLRPTIALGLLAIMSLWLSGLAPAWHLATAHDSAGHRHHLTSGHAWSNPDDYPSGHDDRGAGESDDCRICDLAHASWVGSDLSLDFGCWTDLLAGRLTIDALRSVCLAYISFPLARDPPLLSPLPPLALLSPPSPAFVSIMCNWG